MSELVICLMQVTGKHGAKLREGIDLHSAEIACTSTGSILPNGTVVHVIAEATTSDGTAEREAVVDVVLRVPLEAVVVVAGAEREIIVLSSHK